jgi:Nucleoporin autopeptidase
VHLYFSSDNLIPSGERSDTTASPSFEQDDDQDGWCLIKTLQFFLLICYLLLLLLVCMLTLGVAGADCDLNLDENDENAPPPSTGDCNHSTQKGLQAAIVYEHGAEIEALMPKLRHADYYTEPRIQDLAARERADLGFCSRVPGFVVGRTGYGCIKFLGETDVRKLDLEAIVQFGNKEVVVYRDEKKKPTVGQGLNKPAEVALLNIKCINKKTGERYLTGPKVEKYKEMLAKKTAEQGGEFLSYDPVKAEWRFKVKHFSRYGLFVPPP